MKKVLMIGAGRDVRGGVTTVVNSYFDQGIENDAEIKYISTMEDGSKIKKLLVAIQAYFRFCACVKKYDIVHVHMAAQASFVRKSLFIRKASRAGVKIIIHSHGGDFDDYYLKQSDDRNRKRILDIFALADHVIVLSDEWADFFGRYICEPQKISVFYNGVATPEKQKEDYSDHNVLVLGRLGERKGTFDLLKAIPAVLEEIPDAIFYLGGDGDITQCKAIAGKKGIGDHVRFLGWVKGSEKEALFQQCSVFTLPSYYEGMPMAILEAMSHGLATVSTNVGGIPQIITDGVDGYRIEAGDIQALTDRLVMLLKDKALKRDIGRRGAQKIRDKFDIRGTYSALIALYDCLIRSNEF